MEIQEIEKCLSVVNKLIEESLSESQPGRIADKLIKLSSWKVRLGELVSQAVKILQEAEAKVDYDYSTEFVQARISDTATGKKLPEQDAESLATINTHEAKEQYAQALWYKTRLYNFWQDLETVIDAIKYKVNALSKEWKDAVSKDPGEMRG